jgi:hypothetical protein
MTTKIDVASIPMPAAALPEPADPEYGADAQAILTWGAAREAVWEHNKPQASDCPDWCVADGMHEWESLTANPYVFARTHVVFARDNAEIIRTEYATMAEHVGWDPFEMQLWIGGNSVQFADELTTESLVTICADLLLTASRFIQLGRVAEAGR